MISILKTISTFFLKDLWNADFKPLGKGKAFLKKFLKLSYVFVRELSDEQLALRAMGLVYTTLLSIVPLLAVSFSVLKAFGVHTKLGILLYYFLEPLGPKGADLSLKLIEFVEKVNVGVLGSIGLSTLIYTVISQIQKMENALNFIWNVKGARSFARRFSNYTSILLVGPVIIFSAVGLTASLTSTALVHKLLAIEPFGTIVYFASKVITPVLICCAFAFIYILLPNTKVSFGSALVGGVFAGILWMTTGLVFTSFVVSSAQYSAIYSGFATLILFLIWLYWSFFILLVGGRVAFYHQYPQFIGVKRETFLLSNRAKERLALLIMFLIGNNFYHNEQPWKFDSLSERLGLPAEAVRDMLTLLEKRGLLVPSHDEPPAYFPARDIETILLKEVLESVGMEGEDLGGRSLSIPEIDKLIKRMDDAMTDSLEGKTVKGLALSHMKDGKPGEL